MAGDWIKMRSDLQKHPKVRRMAVLLSADKFRTIGGLHAVWSHFDAHSIDGSLHFCTPDDLDSEVGFPGIARAMETVVWLTVGADVLSLPEFDEHNGQSAKRRAEDQKRKRDERRVRNDADKKADTLRTREEKRREEKREEPPCSPPTGDAPTEPKPEERKGAPAKKASTRERFEIRDDFQPTPEDREWARASERMSDGEIDEQTARFVRHHRAKGNRFKRPDLAWRNWISGRFVGKKPQESHGNRNDEGRGKRNIRTFA